MSAEKLLRICYDAIKKGGTMLVPAYPRIGGIWSADSWVLGDMTASLQDDGYTIMIRDAAGLYAWQTGDLPVKFSPGADEQWLIDFATKLGGATDSVTP